MVPVPAAVWYRWKRALPTEVPVPRNDCATEGVAVAMEIAVVRPVVLPLIRVRVGEKYAES